MWHREPSLGERLEYGFWLLSDDEVFTPEEQKMMRYEERAKLPMFTRFGPYQHLSDGET